MMQILQKPALFILLLASLIFVHELGHFLVAKLFKVKVLRFSLGFGPKLLGFRWGETEYCLCALPLGGYVKMAGDEPGEVAPEEDQGRTFLDQAPWKRAAIAFAGPGMSLLFPVLVYAVAFYFKATDYSSLLGMVLPGRPAYAAGLRPGDRIVEVDGTPVRYFVELQEKISPKWNQKVSIVYERMGQRSTVVVVPDKSAEENALETEVRGLIGVSQGRHAPVVSIADATSPAARAGLQTFDKVVKVGDTEVETYPQLAELLAKATGPVELTAVRDVTEGGAAGRLSSYRIIRATVLPESRDGKPYFGIDTTDRFVYSVRRDSPAGEAGLARGDRLLSLNGQPLEGWAALERATDTDPNKPLALVWEHQGQRVEKSVQLRRIEQTDENGNKYSNWLFGADPDFRHSSLVDGERIPVQITVAEAIRRSFLVVPEQVRQTGLGIYKLLTGRISSRNIGGLLMMYDVASRSVDMGWEYFLRILGFLSINLGLMNLLPIPVLDGFHILSSAFEGIRRRPLSLKTRAIANYIGLVLLVTLMLYAFHNDILRILQN